MQICSWAKTFFFALFFSKLFVFANGADDYLSTQLRVQELFAKFESSVVRVKATREQEVKGKTKRLLKMGSGFFASKNGHVLTSFKKKLFN